MVASYTLLWFCGFSHIHSIYVYSVCIYSSVLVLVLVWAFILIVANKDLLWVWRVRQEVKRVNGGGGGEGVGGEGGGEGSRTKQTKPTGVTT